MASLDTRFSRPSATALGMGALGVVSVGLISTGLWYDSHRSAQAVERAREQVSTAQVDPEPVAVSERTTSAQPTEGGDAGSPAEDTAEPPAAIEAEAESDPETAAGAAPEAVAGAGVRSQVPAPRLTAPVAAVAPQPVRPAPAPVAVPVGQPTTAGGATDATTGEPGGTPSEREITQPVEPEAAPRGALPGLLDLVRPFLPQAGPAQQAPVAEDAPGATEGGADEGGEN